MAPDKTDLGRKIASFPVAAVNVQRAAIVAFLSFVFFLLMLVGFAVRQNFGYFLLASAFLVVYLFTLFGWWVQRSSVLTVYENGLSYRKFSSTWAGISAFEESADAKGAITVKLTDSKRRSVTLPASLDRAADAARLIRTGVRDAGQIE